MPSAIWTGSISFGLVTVPVRLVSATRALDVRFHQLEADTGARIRYRRISEATGEEVPNDRIVKGYEVEPGQYVVVEAEELAALAPKASRQIEIEDFVDLGDIDPVYFEQPYHLVPDKGAEKPYRLLALAMAEEALVAIRPVDGTLVLETMRYADEVLPADRDQPARAAEAAPSERELDMARQLITALADTFDPEKYHDEYREELLSLIERKAAGEEIVAPPPAEEPAKVLDLMAALEASLARTGARKGGRAAEEPARAASGSSGSTRARAPKAAKRSAPRATAKKAPAKKSAAEKAPAKRSRKSA